MLNDYALNYFSLTTLVFTIYWQREGLCTVGKVCVVTASALIGI